MTLAYQSFGGNGLAKGLQESQSSDQCETITYVKRNKICTDLQLAYRNPVSFCKNDDVCTEVIGTRPIVI